jgi:hypothetical protein
LWFNNLKTKNKKDIDNISETIKKTIGYLGMIWILFLFPAILVYCDKLLLFNTMSNWSNAGIDVKILDISNLVFLNVLPKYFTYPIYIIFWPVLFTSLWLLITKKHRWIADGLVLLTSLVIFTASLYIICAKYCDYLVVYESISGKNILQVTLRDEQNQPLRFIELYVASTGNPWHGETKKTDIRGKAGFNLREGEYLVALSEKSKGDLPKYQNMQMKIFIKEGKNIEQIINMDY